MNHWPEGIPQHLAYPSIDLPELLRRKAAANPARKALWFRSRSLTYGEWDALATAFARGLGRLGVGDGDRVILHLPNTPHYPIAFFGALRAGAVVVQSNPIYTPRELEYILGDSGARTLVALDIHWPTVGGAEPRAGVQRVVVGDIADYLSPGARLLYPLVKRRRGWSHTIPREPWIHWFRDLLTRGAGVGNGEGVPNDPGKPAVLQYTGGTTGTPKAAVLTHANLVANALQTAAWLADPVKEETFLSALPFFHVYGLTAGLLAPLALGAKIVLHPDPRDVRGILRLVDRRRPTIFPGVPTLYVAINHHPKVAKHDLKSIRACISGAAPLPAEVRATFERLTGGRLVEGYGLSEASPVTHCNPVFGRVKDGSIGLPLPDTDARVADVVTKEEVALGEIGELQVRGPQVMKGYWNRPEETMAVLRDGWLSTGDMARMDDEGYFYIVDRKKDMINCGGYKVYPREVEEVLFQHPSVKEAAAVGVPDEYRGESVKAVVVLQEGKAATAEEIVAFCRQRLAPYKVPRTVEFTSELPKTLVGKVLRRALRPPN